MKPVDTNASLQLDRLVVARGGKPVVHEVSMQFAPGEVTALVGANGAGKSSIVMAMAGAIPTASGQVTWGEHVLTGQSADKIRQMGIALIPEGHPVLGGLNVLDNLRVSASHLPAHTVPEAIDRALSLFPELSSRLHIPASALSGGQKQMLLIGQAIVSSPRFILIDELSLGLAPTVVKRLAERLGRLVDQGVGVVLIEQFTTLALQLARRAYVLERGRIVFDGTARDLRENSEILHSAYLGAT